MNDPTPTHPRLLLPDRLPASHGPHHAIFLGDALEILCELPDGAIDAVVTDPPAGISFLGMRWDTFRPSRSGPRGRRDRLAARRNFVEFMTEVMGECRRVLKPGAHMLTWAIPRTSHWMATAVEDAGFEIRDVITHHYGSGFPKGRLLAEPWPGWSTTLKPASEHWILSRKPLAEKYLDDNLLHHGVGAINVEGCRIHDQDGLARWPANLLLTHDPRCRSSRCVRDCPVAELDRQSARAHRPGASRFFYVSKPTTEERNLGIPLAQPLGPRSRELFRPNLSSPGNNHPTVKSVALMAHLCRLITPPGGIVLDPFMGSGTTGVAALRENMLFVATERDSGYVQIAGHRLQHAEGLAGARRRRAA
jgi:DNA modification methylase